MKKLLSLAVVAFACAAVADGYVGQTIGVTKITTSSKDTIVAVPFKSLTNANVNVSANDLVCTNGLPADTRLAVFVNDSYGYWELAPEGWVVPANQSIDVPANSLVQSGGAIWVQLPTAPVATQDIYIYGDFTTEPTTSSIAGGESKVANLVANPLQSAAKITIEDPVANDQIIVPNVGIYNYKTKTVGETTVGAWRKGTTSGLPTIEVGQGIWYVREANASGTTITWVAP